MGVNERKFCGSCKAASDVCGKRFVGGLMRRAVSGGMEG